MADKIMVMYAGRPVEFGTAEEIFYESRHPYTWGLIIHPEQAIGENTGAVTVSHMLVSMNLPSRAACSLSMSLCDE